MRSHVQRGASLAVLVVTSSACQVYDPSLLEGSDPGAGGSGGSAARTVSTTTGGTADNQAVGTTTTTGSVESGSSTSGGVGGDASASSASSTTGAGSGPSSSSTSGDTGGTVGVDCEAIDCCPTDDDKVDPGQCGCGVPDTDSDGDGFADCVDECPDDENKSSPGACGCGIPDQDTASIVGCVPLRTSLVHRFSFDGTGTLVTDKQGGAQGTVVGTALDGSGVLVLNDGSDDQYVELPSGMVSSLHNATLEVWFEWAGGPMWTRLFDFGSTVEGVPGEAGTGQTFVMFTPRGPDGPDYPYVTFYNGDSSTEALCSATKVLTSGEPHHLVLSLDTDNNVLALYIDGMMSCAKALVNDLDSLDDVNSWIGRSQFEADALFAGSIDEFRIYDVALSEEQARFSLAQGPNPAFLDD